MSVLEKHNAPERLAPLVCSDTSERTCTVCGNNLPVCENEDHLLSLNMRKDSFSRSWECLLLIPSALSSSLGGSQEESLWLGSSVGKSPGPQRGVMKKSSILVQQEKSLAAYPGLTKPYWVICAVGLLRIGIKTVEVRRRVRGCGREGSMGHLRRIGSDGIKSLRSKIKGISFRLDKLRCYSARHFFQSLISISLFFLKHKERTRENCYHEV